MEVHDSTSPPGSPTPAGGPLQVTSPDRVNRHESRGSALRGQSRESTVHDKISQFNNMTVSMQSRALERKTADAALKRALVGREEAEAETRRLKEEARALKKAIDEGKERERKVGERLEAVMDNFARTKETHAHTITAWEKEVRRMRKEIFKNQSSVVKLQEELKSSRETTRALQENLQQEREKEHGRQKDSIASTCQLAEAIETLARTEQQRDDTSRQLESTRQQLQNTELQLENTKQQFDNTKLELENAKEQLRNTQRQLATTKWQFEDTQQQSEATREKLDRTEEQLEKTQEQVKVVEQERDAYKAAAKNEEIARIAAEGRFPLPTSDDNDDEFSSPPKKKARRGSFIKRGQDPRVSLTSMEIVSSAATELEIEDLSEQVEWERQRADRAQEMIEFMQAECLMHCCPCSKSKRRTTLLASQEQASRRSPGPPTPKPADLAFATDSIYALGPSDKADRRRALSPTFFPKERHFRTISKQDAALALKAKQEAEIVSREPMDLEMDAPTFGDETDKPLRLFARTPSVEPPAFALHGPERTSLLSLINAPRGDALADAVPVTYSIPTLPDTEPPHPRRVKEDSLEKEEERDEQAGRGQSGRRKRKHHAHLDDDESGNRHHGQLPKTSGASFPDTTTSTTSYTFTSTTTVPLRETATSANSFFTAGPRNVSTGSKASFDQKDPGMIPTVTREQALAMIRERRGRARSATQLAPGPSLKAKSKERRDMSAPTEQSAKRQRRS